MFLGIHQLLLLFKSVSLTTILCLIVGGRSNKMQHGENYEDFFKFKELFLGHSHIIIK